MFIFIIIVLINKDFFFNSVVNLDSFPLAVCVFIIGSSEL